jgi:2'-5' RNA ligase
LQGVSRRIKRSHLAMPSPEMRKRYVVAFPRIVHAEAWQEILSVRDRFDPLARDLPPHLTLVFPFEDTLSDTALAEHVRGVLCGVHSFPVTFRDITAHENEYLFLNVKRGNDALVALHDALYTGPLARHLVRLHTYVPHVTVGRVPAHQLAAALEATSAIIRAHEAIVDTITVRAIDSDDKRTAVLDLPLQEPPAL